MVQTIVDIRMSSQARMAHSAIAPKEKEEDEITVYPVPSSGLVYIKANENTLLTEVKLCDLAGRLLLTKYIKNKSGVYRLDLNDFAAGSFTLYIKDVTNRISIKQLILTK
ncbi:MAG: T9SS type A sorting domain-containing protein [Bacteroidia bacterium]